MHHLTGYHVAHLQNLILLKLVNKGQHRRATPSPCLHQLRDVDIHVLGSELSLLETDKQILQSLQARESVWIAMKTC